MQTRIKHRLETLERSLRAAELLELMRSVNRIGRTVSPLEFPGLREQLRMPRGDGYRRLIAAAGSFIQVARAYKAVFLVRGLDPDFIEQIEAKIPELEAASTVINHGKAQRIGSTAGLADLARRGMEGLRELDAILSHQFRRDPALLVSWKGAARVQRDAVRTPPEEEPDTAPAAAASGTPTSRGTNESHRGTDLILSRPSEGTPRAILHRPSQSARSSCSGAD